MRLSMTPLGPTRVVGRPHGLFIARLGVVALAGALVLSVLGWLLVADLFRRLDDTLGATGEALRTVESTLDVADSALETLTVGLDIASAASAQAAASAITVSEAVAETAAIVGNEVPDGIESIRATMPGLIEASAVIDATLSALSLLGVPYNPTVPLDEAFRQLDRQLAPLPRELRENAETISRLVPEAEEFGEHALALGTQMQEMRASVDRARALIADYGDNTSMLDELLTDSGASLRQTRLLAQVLVIVLAGFSVLTTSALIITGRALAGLEVMSAQGFSHGLAGYGPVPPHRKEEGMHTPSHTGWEGRWEQLKERAKETWEITDDDLDVAEGNYEELIGRIKERTGETEERIRDLIERD